MEQASVNASKTAVVAITGSGGLVGSALSASLGADGYRVLRLVRRVPQGDGERRWDPQHPDRRLLAGVDVLVHLAGAPIGGRFTARHKRAIRESRVEPTRLLARLCTASGDGPGTMITASAVGFYGPDRGDEVLTERAERGAGFLADLVADWEAAAMPAAQAGARTVQIRTGIVQARSGGMLSVLRPLFAAGLGGRLGNGEQWLSWIALEDVIGSYRRAIDDADLSGPVNAVAPNPVRNREYTATLARTLRRPAVLRVPTTAIGLLLGRQGAREFALASQRAAPARLLAAGYTFRYPELGPALHHIAGRDPVPEDHPGPS